MTSATRTWIFLTSLMVFIILLGQTLGGREGLLWGVGIALSINSLVYFYTDLRLNYMLGGQLLEGKDPWKASDMLDELTTKARIPKPKVFVLPNSSPQTLVMGRSWKSARILVTQGLLDQLSEQELRAVLAYHVASIKRMDILAYTVASAFLDLLMTLARSIDSLIRIALGAKKNPNSKQSQVFSLLISPIAGLLLRLNVGPSNYLGADKLAGELSGDPQKLAEVIWKLDSYSATKPINTPAATAHLWLVNPLSKRGWTKHFHVQPSVERRIRNLIGYYPI